MTAAVAAAGDSSTLQGWLQCLAGWLGTPLRCHALRLVWVPQPVESAGWVESLESVHASTIDAGEGGADEGGGWLLPIEHGSSGVLCLFCASRADATTRAGMDPRALEQAAIAVAAGWSLARPQAGEGVDVALVERRALRKMLHDFRNGLNALLMNAATLTYRADVLPESLRRFAVQLQREGERCSNAMDSLELSILGRVKHAPLSAGDAGTDAQQPRRAS